MVFILFIYGENVINLCLTKKFLYKEVMSKVFVSYKGTDKDKVFLIVRWLESELGSYFWIDKEGIQSNERFSKVIVNAINITTT